MAGPSRYGPHNVHAEVNSGVNDVREEVNSGANHVREEVNAGVNNVREEVNSGAGSRGAISAGSLRIAFQLLCTGT